ncbi:hypothetical protein ACEQ8H_008851 [Pleosporales sp. CAS-2024a]
MYTALQSVSFYAWHLRNDAWDNLAAQGDGDGRYKVLEQLTPTALEKTKSLHLSALVKATKQDPRKAMDTEGARVLVRLVVDSAALFQWRRSEDQTWLDGNSIIPYTSTVVERAITSEPNAEENTIVAEFENRLQCERMQIYRERKKSDSPPSRRLSPAATVPQLLSWWENRDPNNRLARWNRDMPDMRVWNDRKTEESAKRAGKAAKASSMEQSSKWLAALGKLKDWSNEVRKCDGLPVKAIVVTDDVTTMAMWSFLLLRSLFKERGGVINYDASMGFKERDKNMTLFMEDDSVWLMVATLATIREGLNIQRASKIMLLEPNANNDLIIQLWSRARRMGQEEAEIEFVVVSNPASKREARLVNSREGSRIFKAETEIAEVATASG